MAHAPRCRCRCCARSPIAPAQILSVHLQRRGLPLADDVSVDEIAGMTMGFTGADLANLVNEVRRRRVGEMCDSDSDCYNTRERERDIST